MLGQQSDGTYRVAQRPTNLGYANGWSETPEVVKACRQKQHGKSGYMRETRLGNCLTQYECGECNYYYRVDSSD